MREAALARRKKAAEDLLQWHQRLLEEERKIAELEMAANTIIKQAPSMVSSGQDSITKQKHNFKGSQLNLLWTNMTGRSEKKFKEDENYSLSQASLEKFCKEAKRIADRNEKSRKHSSDTSFSTDESNQSKYSRKSTKSNSIRTDENVTAKSNSYSTDFESQEVPEEKIEEIVDEVPSEIIPSTEINTKPVLENEIDKSKSTLNEIMQNISNITDEISAIYKLSTVANSANETIKDSGTIRSEIASSKNLNQDPDKSNSEILSDNQILTDSEVEKTIENDKTKTSESIKTKDRSEKTIENDQTRTSETLKTKASSGDKSATLPIETNEGSEPKIFSSDLQTDITQQLNDILSEGTKRINSILSTRSHKTSAISSEIGEDTISNDNKSLDTKMSEKMVESVNDEVKLSYPSQKPIENDLSQDTINILSQSLKTDMDQHLDDIMNEGTKRIHEILNSRTDISTEKKSKSNIDDSSQKNISTDTEITLTKDKINDFKTDIDHQIDEILSEGTKRISDILSSRSQRSSVLSEGNIKNKTLSDGTNISNESIRSDVQGMISDLDKTNEILSEETLKPSNQGQSNKLTESLSAKIKSDITHPMEDILSDSTKKISDILGSRSQRSSLLATDSDHIKNKSLSDDNNISDKSIKSNVKEIISENTLKTDGNSDQHQNQPTESLSGKIKSDITQAMEQILSDSTKKISDILSSRSQRTSVIVTASDSTKSKTKSRSDGTDISNESIRTDVKEIISDHLDKTSEMLSDETLKTCDLSNKPTGSLNSQKSAITTESGTMKNKTKLLSNITNISTDSIRSDVKQMINDSLDKANEILSEDTLKISDESQNNKRTESLSLKTEKTSLDTESTKSKANSKSISTTVLKSNDPTDTTRTKNESLKTSVQLIKTLTESVKTSDEMETGENSSSPTKNNPPDSTATLNSKVELSSTTNELEVEINYAGHKSQNNESCQIGNDDIFNQRSLSIRTKNENKVSRHSDENRPEIKSTLSDMSSMKDEDAENSISNLSGANISKNLKTLEKANRVFGKLEETSSLAEIESQSETNDTSSIIKTKECVQKKVSEHSNEPSNISKSGVLILKPLQTSEKASIVSLLEEIAENANKSEANKISSIVNTIEKSLKEIKHSTSLNKSEEKLQEKGSTLSEMSSIKDDEKTSTILTKSGGVLIFKPLKTSEKSSIVSKLEEISRAEAESKIETMNEINSQITSSNTLKDSKINGHSPNSKMKTFQHNDEDSFELFIDPIEKNLIDDLNKSSKIEVDDDTTASSISTSDELSHSSDLKPDNEVSNDNKKVTDTADNSIIEQLISNDSKANGIKSEIGKSEELSQSTTKEKNNSGKDSPDFVDVKKRVSEILADAHSPRGDKSPRLQDIYTTTYDILSPDRSPEMGSPVNSDKDLVVVNQLFGEEAEALLKKQLAIEQEIKQLEQQQKEQIPYLYMREIPNKPPPPYTPPQPLTNSIVPASVDQLDTIVCSLSRILHITYFKGTLETSTLTERDKRTFTSRNNVEQECYEFVFDLCKELAVEHYKQFKDEPRPSWLRINKKSLAPRKPFNESELREYLFSETKVLLGFEKVAFKENIVTKWSRKKRDHVDEILVMESQAEESEWTNYDEDEVIVKDELTNDIMNMLLTETAHVFQETLRKKRSSSQSPS